MNEEQYLVEIDKFLLKHRMAEHTKRTIKIYQSELMKFIDFAKDKPIDKLMLIDYKDYLNELPLSATTKNRNIVVINQFIKWLGYENIYIKQFKIQFKTTIDNPITDQEHKRMLRWAKKLNMEDMYLIIKIFAYTGARVEELKIFTVENLDSPFIKVYNKGKERKIILRNDLLREIKAYCVVNGIDSGIIFRSPKNPMQMLNPATIWKRLQKIAGSAKINKKKIHAHAWRHLFAKSFLKIPGNNEFELADILGHKDLKTTRIYTKTSLQEQKEKLEKIKY